MKRPDLNWPRASSSQKQGCSRRKASSQKILWCLPAISLRGVTHDAQEVGIGMEDVAVRGELDHGQERSSASVSASSRSKPLVLFGDVAGNLEYPGHPALVLHREIGRLQPARLPCRFTRSKVPDCTSPERRRRQNWR